MYWTENSSDKYRIISFFKNALRRQVNDVNDVASEAGTYNGLKDLLNLVNSIDTVLQFSFGKKKTT